MGLTTFLNADVHFLVVLTASLVVLACFCVLFRAYRRNHQYKGKQKELQRPFIKRKRGSLSPTKSPLLFGRLQYANGQTGSPPKRCRHSPLLIKPSPPVQRNFLGDVITSINKLQRQKSPGLEMKKVASPSKKAKPKVVFTPHRPQVHGKEGSGLEHEDEDAAEARIVFYKDYEAANSINHGSQDTSTEAPTQASAVTKPKFSTSANSYLSEYVASENEKQLSPTTSTKYRQRSFQVQRYQPQNLFSVPTGRAQVASQQRPPLWAHSCHSDKIVEKARDKECHKIPMPVRSETANKFEGKDTGCNQPHCNLDGNCEKVMNSVKKMSTNSSSNNASVKSDSNPLDNNSDSLDNILGESTSRSRRRKDRRSSRSSVKESNACSHRPSVGINDVVANASKTEVFCAQCGITLSKPQCFYSLGSLCTDGEVCETDSDDINRHPVGDIDDDPPMVDVQSHHDTGYTSSDDFDNDSTFSKELDPTWSHDKRETDSYDGDYESDNEETGLKPDSMSDDKALKPLASVGEPIAIKDYALREWKSDTPTSRAMKKGYGSISSLTGCHHLRQIRGDNYCAIRAVLFQALAGRLPILNLFASDKKTKLEKIPSTLSGAFLNQWSFANRLPVSQTEITTTLEKFLVFFSSQIRKICDIPGQPERIDCTLSLLCNETEEFKILEAIKLLMYDAAVKLYTRLNRGEDVPVFAMLLFARDSSESPRGLLTNHLNRTGDTGGLEQVEMCLLGYTLGVVIQVIRPSQVDKEDFIVYYPSLDDVPKYTHTVTLVAEDDRHYNIVM